VTASVIRRIFCLLSLGCVSPVLVAQENTVRVEFERDPGKSTVIGAFQRQGATYISLTDLVHVAQLSAFENHEARKLEIKFPSYRIKISGGNPFIVITGTALSTSGNRRENVLQLSREVIFAASSYFIPLEGRGLYLDLLLNMPVTYDRTTRVIRIGSPAVARGFDIPSVHLEPKSNGTLIRITATKRLEDIESWLRQDNWLYVTIPDARADITAINAMKPAGLIRSIVAIQSPASVQLTFKLTGRIATSEILRDEATHDILISVRAQSKEETAVPEKKQRDVQAGLEDQRKRWELDVIVIDAGHGGKDWGASGVSGVREKDVTLGVALKLGKLIQKNMKGVRVIYTRKDDRFVEVDRRGQIANEAGGKLFISIHANSLKQKPHPTRGFEVYLLRPGRTEEAIAIAERENAVVELEEGYESRYKELTDENFILVTMAQTAHMRASEQFADLAQKEMESTTGLQNRGVKQAGFYVLVGASMPNVLVETAYLSNKQDERFLKSETGQQKIADALFHSIRLYKEEYEKQLTEGKDIGQQ